MLAAQLTAALERLGIPVAGVTIGVLEDRATWTVQYHGATGAQQEAGAELVATFDPASDADYLRDQAAQAAKVFLARPDTQAMVRVLATRLDVADAQLTSELEVAFKSLYRLPSL
jgi:hypothetical protein